MILKNIENEKTSACIPYPYELERDELEKYIYSVYRDVQIENSDCSCILTLNEFCNDRSEFFSYLLAVATEHYLKENGCRDERIFSSLIDERNFNSTISNLVKAIKEDVYAIKDYFYFKRIISSSADGIRDRNAEFLEQQFILKIQYENGKG